MAAAEPQRCSWCEGDTLYERYHDEEWGVPVFDADALFERLVLESMQAGLSWLTVLRKREHMQSQFYDFNISRLAAAGELQIERWLQDPGIIRHRGKLEAMVNNARIALQTPDFSAWLWQFAPESRFAYASLTQVPSVTDDSKAMSRALKQAGYRFVGPTTCYAFMQSVGMVNDHVQDCWRHSHCAKLPGRREGE
jgi:DNA-3-methyladenine glycosylase I